MKKLLLLVTLVPLAYSNTELDPIIHSSKQEIKEKEFLGSTKSLNTDEIEQYGAHQLEEILQQFAGISSSHSGAIGGETSVFIRGGESRHTLVLIDGVKVHDPTSTGRTLNLAMLKTLDIERIEVLKGTHSVLYGSDAIGGVINIITKSGQKKNYVLLGGGYTTKAQVNHSFLFENSSLSLNAYSMESDALSVALDEAEKDNISNKGFTLTHELDGEKVKTKTTIKLTDNHSDTDRYDITENETVDDEDSFSKDTQTFLAHNFSLKLAEQKTLRANLSFSKYKRKNKYYQSFNYLRDFYEGDNLQTEISIKDDFLDGNLIYGFSQSTDIFNSGDLENEQQIMTDLYYNHHQAIWGVVLDYGGRLTHNNEFGDHFVYRAAIEKPIMEKKLNIGAILATGFKAPSVYQQFSPDSGFGPIGNEELAPEKSLSKEIYTEARFGQYSGKLALFDQVVENLIDFEVGNGYVNSGELTISGLEIENKLSFEQFYIGVDAIFLSFETEDNSKVLRRPSQKYALRYGHKINDLHSVGASWIFVGERNDKQGSEELTLGSYDVLDVNYKLSTSLLNLYAGIKNVFDRKYELIKDYSTLGRSVYVDVKISY